MKKQQVHKYFFVSDVHSYLKELQLALAAVGFSATNEYHTLVVLGDVFDRGRESWATYQFLKTLPRKILVRGNHEDLLIDMVQRGSIDLRDMSNGTADTGLQLATADSLGRFRVAEVLCASMNIDMFHSDQVQEVVNWINNEFVDYVEFTDLIGTHAGVAVDKGDFVMWHNSRWVNPYKERDAGKWRITGHWFAAHHWKADGLSWMGDETYISQERRLIGIDSCVMLSGKINVFIYETKEKPQLGKTYNEWMMGE